MYSILSLINGEGGKGREPYWNPFSGVLNQNTLSTISKPICWQTFTSSAPNGIHLTKCTLYYSGYELSDHVRQWPLTPLMSVFTCKWWMCERHTHWFFINMSAWGYRLQSCEWYAQIISKYITNHIFSVPRDHPNHVSRRSENDTNRSKVTSSSGTITLSLFHTKSDWFSVC